MAVAVSLLIAVAVLLVVPFHPEAGLLNLVHAITPNTVTARNLDWFLVESGGNFAMFVLVGVAAFVVLRRPIAAAMTGCLLSAAAEAAQLIIPSRVASWTDLATNCLGTLVGVGGTLLVTRIAARHGRAPRRSTTS